MRTSHRLLLRYWYDPVFDFSLVSVAFESRGAPGNRVTVSGPDIERLGAEYFEISGPDMPVCIPYHRIRMIWYRDKITWAHRNQAVIP